MSSPYILYNASVARWNGLKSIWEISSLKSKETNDFNNLNKNKDKIKSDTNDIEISTKSNSKELNIEKKSSSGSSEKSQKFKTTSSLLLNDESNKLNSDYVNNYIEKESFYFNSSYLKLSKLSILTYNVWFDNYNWDNRLKGILSILESKNADVVCLQEVTDRFFRFITDQEFIKKTYKITIIPSQMLCGYDVLILSKFECNAYVSPFYSKMGRKLLYITIINNSNDLIKIGTVHLESLNNSNIRENQLKLSYDLLKSTELENKDFNCTHAFLLGDFNFTEKETHLINNNGFVDFGYEVVIKDNFNFSKWCTMKEMNGYPHWRPDRVTYLSSSKSFTVTHFEIVGKNKIEILDKSNPVDTPSDHFGIYFECSL